MKAENWSVVDNGSRVVGRFDLVLDSGMIIRGATLVNGREGVFVSLPQRSWTTKDGKSKYAAIIEFSSKERAVAFGAKALQAANELRGAKEKAA